MAARSCPKTFLVIHEGNFHEMIEGYTELRSRGVGNWIWWFTVLVCLICNSSDTAFALDTDLPTATQGNPFQAITTLLHGAVEKQVMKALKDVLGERSYERTSELPDLLDYDFDETTAEAQITGGKTAW